MAVDHDDSRGYDEALDRAQARASTAPHGIGAAYVQDRSDPGRRGWFGEVAVDDGTGKKLSLLVQVTAEAGGQPHMAVNGDKVAELMEELAGRFEGDDRLKELLAATMEGPGILLDRWFPEDYKSIFA